MLLIGTSAAPARGGALLLAVAAFAAGLAAGAWIAPAGAGGGVANDGPLQTALPPALSALRSGHPAELLRVIDGDTFEARVRIWPGMDITTKVRLRRIDAPEMRARCEDERARAVAAREELTRLLAQGGIGISGVGQDKYGGRVDADVSTAGTADVASAMLGGGFARRYFGGRRESWCG